MKELLINIYCPSASKSYDFWIPKNITAKQAIELICEDITGVENNNDIFSDPESLLLCSYQKGKTLPMEFTLEQFGIRSGDRLALV